MNVKYAENVVINSKYIKTGSATIEIGQYHTHKNVTAVMINYFSEGYCETFVASVNLSASGIFPPSEKYFFAPDYSEYTGIPHALEAAGIATIIEPVKIGFGSGYLMKLNK